MPVRALRTAIGAGLVATALAAVPVAADAGAAGLPVRAQTATGGNVFAYGGAPRLGSLAGDTLSARTVSIVSTSDREGYWLAASDGGVFSFGDARFVGSAGGAPLAQPVVGMAGAPGNAGYWLVASDGGVFNYGTARFYGSAAGAPLAQPVVGMAATPDGHGYWMVASDGGIFNYGDAHFFGSAGGHPLSEPVVGMAATPDGLGYWMVASDGGILTYGDAHSYGSTAGRALPSPIVGMAAAPDGHGYWLVGGNGSVYAFGSATAQGSPAPLPYGSPAMGIAAGPSGYWVGERGPYSSPFSPKLAAYLHTLPETVTAAVEDLNTGVMYVYHPGLSLVLGSTVKVQILGTLLSEAQAQKRWLTPTEIQRATGMIEVSNNADGQALFDEVGGAAAIQAWDDSIGLTGTYVYTNWGISTSTAVDQVRLLNIYASSNSTLTDRYRTFGLYLLAHVELSQIFGINVGPPESGVQAVKTGRIPGVGAHNAIGWIRADGRNYLIAGLVQYGPSDPVEEAAIEPISVDAWVTQGP